MFCMGTITINVSDKVEREFRETVKKDVGVGKGKLGLAVEDAIRRWVEEKRQKEIAERQTALMREGMYKLPKGWKFNREEAYAR